MDVSVLLVTLIVEQDELYQLVDNMDLEDVENHILSEIANDHDWVGDHLVSYEVCDG